MLAGVNCKTITGIEHNRYMPSLKTALKLSKVFNVSPAVFLVKTEEFFSQDTRTHFKTLRFMLGLKQKEFAELCGVDPSTIRDWELGKRELSRQYKYYIEGILAKLPLLNPTRPS